MRQIDIAKDFSPYPAGRYRTDGDASGEAFREDHLIPGLNDGHDVNVDFGGVAGAGTGFLEEAFGGLVRHGGFNMDALHDRLTLTCDDDTAATVWGFIVREEEIAMRRESQGHAKRS